MAVRAKRARITRVEVVSAIASWCLSLVTTAALAAVGWFGHSTHWTFGLGGHADEPHAAAVGESVANGTPPGAGGHGDAATAGGASAADGPAAAESGSVRFGSREAMARAGIELVPVEERKVVSELRASGVVRYDQRHIAQLSARVPGTVWRVEKHIGDDVEKGEILLVVESRDVGRLKADFLNALVACEARREQLAILEEVKGAVMGRQIREATSALREARNHLAIAEQALVNLGLDVAIADYEPLDDAARAAKIRTVGLPETLLETVDPDHLTSNLLPLFAPFDGVVIGREAVVGEVVDPTVSIFEVADVSTMWVVLSVSKEDAGRVAVGQQVRFRPDGADAEYASRVDWISTQVDPQTRTLEVRAEIPGASALRANTFGRGRIEVEERGRALLVPRRSVQWDGSRWVVFVPEGEGRFAAHPVRPGVYQGEFVEIVADFAGGPPPTHVVGSGSHVLKSQVLLDSMEAGEL